MFVVTKRNSGVRNLKSLLLLKDKLNSMM